MKHDDWIGLGASLGLHLLLLLVFAFVITERTPPRALGAVQVEIGDFAEGQPVRQAEALSEPQQEREASPATAQAQERASSQESAPVDLPDQERAPIGEDPAPEERPDEPEQEAPPVAEPSETPDEETETADGGATPEERETAEGATAADETATQGNASSEAAGREASDADSLAAGGPEAERDTGTSGGTEGTGEEQERTAPFDIEGLNRTRLRGALPQYTEKVNAVIKVEIIVDPQGRVVGRRLLRKANPSLERSVLEALRRWRFNPLPRNAPQENQTGVVTFRFQLE